MAPGGVGELLACCAKARNRAAASSSGYYSIPQLTESGSGAMAGFHTGDLVRTGADGLFFCCYRSLEEHRAAQRGENIAAVEVESAWQTHA